MNIRQKKMAPAWKGKPTVKPPAIPYSFPAPIKGWVLNESIAAPSPGGAVILDNWECTTTGISARAGSSKYATLDADVASMFTYRSGGVEAFFAATPTKVYNLTTVVDPLVVPTAAFSGQTSGYYSAVQFGTVGGDYLYAVNGTDAARLYDGATWTAIDGVSSPAITGVTTSTLSHVWSFASRLFFVKKGTLSAYYLPVDSIGGAANEVSLAGIFKLGGSLLFGATWSLDAGDGLDDKCVFVSTEGEVAIYEGTNPGSAADWRKVGVYQINRPLGQNGTMQAGGDLLIATVNGFVPLSEAINRDVAALAMAAVSAPIAPYWQQQAARLTGKWEILKWPRRNLMFVSQPGDDKCLVANLQTGAWSRFTGWATNCLGFYSDNGFYGGGVCVYRMDSTGADDGIPYTCSYLGRHEGMGADGAQKTILQMRAIMKSSTPTNAKVSALTDFNTVLSTAPNAPTALAVVDGWDSGLWDTALWGGTSSAVSIGGTWVSVGRTGYAIAPEVQLTFGDVTKPQVELVSIDATFNVGALVS